MTYPLASIHFLLADMTINKDLEKKLLNSLDELEDKIIKFEDTTEKFDALDALKKARELLDLENPEE